MAASNLDEHQLGAEEQLPHDISEKAGIHLRVGEFTRKGAAVEDELMSAGGLVTVQRQNGGTEIRTGSLEDCRKTEISRFLVRYALINQTV